MSKHFGQILRSRRRELGLTQREVAARIGVSRTLVTYWERGESCPQPERLEALARVLDLPGQGSPADSATSQGPHADSDRSQGTQAESATSQGPHADSATYRGPHADSARSQGPHGDSARSQGPHADWARSQGPRADSATSREPHADSARSQGTHGDSARSTAGLPSRPTFLRRRRRIRPPYPHSATVGQMLQVGGWAPRVHDAARQKLGEVACAEVGARFPRDTPYELLVAFHALSRGTRLVETSPDSQECPLFVLDDFEKKPGGDQRQPALLWRGTDAWMLLYGQVRVLGAGRRPCRVDFLIHYRRRRSHGVWMTVEIDGAPHELTPNQDADRAEGLGIPELRYDNEQTRYSDFFDRLLRDVRKTAVVAARWDRTRKKEANLRRHEREQQAAQRRAR